MLVTNGTLLPEKGAAFWEACRDSAIEVDVTIYPGMNGIFEAARETGASFGVNVVSYNTVEDVKTSWHCPLDLTGQQVPSKSFARCNLANACVHLRHGRLYTCCVAAYASFFIDYFRGRGVGEVSVSENDSIDIYKARSGAEVLDFLARPIPFCRFCMIEKRSSGLPWSLSRRDIGEWTIG
ncbi:MAG: hypothetical protein LBR38_02470 [Synergistaceae bacterium]|jgi:hypothetical protein|nr:hypothetical protein [Synergistaceae bacterium]